MRISTNLMQQLGVNAILDQQTKLSQTQQQLATGLRIMTPADDPAGASTVLSLTQSSSITNQYQSNITSARSSLNMESGALSGVVDALQRANELALQGNTGTLSNDARSSLALEVQQLLEQVKNLANTQDSNGAYIFAGYKSGTQAYSQSGSGYVYNGDSGQRMVQISDGRQIPVSDSGYNIFGGIRTGNGSFTAGANASNIGSGVIDAGSVTDASAYVSGDYNVVFPQETTATGSLTFNDANANDNLGYTLSINGTAVYSVNEAGAPVNTLGGLAAQINASVATTGVRAYVTGGKLYLANTTPGAGPITVSEQLSGASDGDSDTLTGYFGSTLTGASNPSSTITYNPQAATTYIVEDSGNNVVTSGSYQSGDQIAFNGMQVSITGAPTTGDQFAIGPSANQDIFTTLQNLADALNISVTDDASQARLNNAINGVLSSLDLSLNNVINYNAQVGSRLNALDSQESINSNLMQVFEETKSKTQDLDYASAASKLNLQLVALQAAQQSFVKIQNLSLFNYL
jgi:flagellar hook-associated protein 3 FlgL